MRARLRGLIGRDGLNGALLLVPAKGVHTLFMRFPIDVAYLRGSTEQPDSSARQPDSGARQPDSSARQPDSRARFVVLSTTSLRPWSVGLLRLRATAVLEAPQGAFKRWNLQPGDELKVAGDEMKIANHDAKSR